MSNANGDPVPAPRKRKVREEEAPPTAEGGDARPPPNRLLAGYLAHEFLTRGTLFGQRWDPARTESAPAPSSSGSKAKRPSPSQGGTDPGDEIPGSAPKRLEAYADVAKMLRGEGAHIPGIVNPTQLIGWLHLQKRTG